MGARPGVPHGERGRSEKLEIKLRILGAEHTGERLTKGRDWEE